MSDLISRIASGSADLLKPKGVCSILKISRSTLNRWIGNDFPRPDIHIAGKPRWERETIKLWLATKVTK